MIRIWRRISPPLGALWLALGIVCLATTHGFRANPKTWWISMAWDVLMSVVGLWVLVRPPCKGCREVVLRGLVVGECARCGRVILPTRGGR